MYARLVWPAKVPVAAEPPIETPTKEKTENGMNAGVRAWVFACGDCSDRSKMFIGFLETYTKEAKEAVEAMAKPMGPDARPPMFSGEDMMAREQGHLICVPGDAKWVPYGGEKGALIVQSVQEHCGAAANTKPCYPKNEK